MIFGTTGTHTGQFNRMVGALDCLAENMEEEVFIQYGYKTKPPVFAKGEKIIDRQKMEQLLNEARVIITQGGPAGIWECFGVNKIPIVVPRLQRFDEVVDDHQLHFCRRLASSKRIILVEDVDLLGKTILAYDQLKLECVPPTAVPLATRRAFCLMLSEIV
jgi:UDP-N-acetylglucosamine transferase subunit ALG13